jgi:cytochrome c biogenesis protein CcmG, thiol:disulfide interchange protein DsbE
MLAHRTYSGPLLLLVSILLYAGLTSAGEPLDLSQHRGKVVLVDFWASWCEPCRHSFPWLNEMQAKYGDRLVIIGVNVDRERADAKRFLTQVPAQFQLIYDPAGELAAQYDVLGMPSSYVFDTAGKLVDKHIGFRKALRAEREAQLRQLFTSIPPQSSTHE